MNNRPMILAAATVLAATTLTVSAQPFARGAFNGWGTTQMVDDGDGSYSLSVTGLTPGAIHAWKIDTVGDWSAAYPGSDNAISKYDASGEFTFHWFPGSVFDGWQPTANRVGYDDPGNLAWEIHGDFNGWNDAVDTAARQMTNMGNGLYSVNYTIATPGTNIAFKFRAPSSWDYQFAADGGSGGANCFVTTTSANQVVNFELDLPKGRWHAGPLLPPATNSVTFVVDMSVPISTVAPPNYGFLVGSDTLYVRGDFNGWTSTNSSYAISNQISPGIYSNTVQIVAYSGTTINYKFFGDVGPGEENPLLSCGGVRTLLLDSTNVVAPVAAWDDRTLNGNTVTLQVDMGLQASLGNFDPMTEGVYVRGNFNSWGNAPATEPPLALTPLPSPNTNIYAGTLTNVPVGACLKYKFWRGTSPTAIDGVYEDGSDRETVLAGTSNVVAAVPFSNVDACDVLEETNYVTFSVNMTDAVGHTGSPIFSNQTVYINGNFIGWNLDQGPGDWGTSPDPAYALTNMGGGIHSAVLPFPPGRTLRVQYKYSIGGEDNEAPSGSQYDHVRYVRTVPGQTSYTMPLDNWKGTNAAPVVQEPAVGYITAAPGSPGQVNLQWLGLKCAGLESATSVTGPWTGYPASEGTSSTNWPTTGEQRYFRIVKPVSP